MRPLRSSSLKCSHVAQRGTRFEFAMQDARRVRMGLEHADGLARLDQQRLVVAERLQRREDRVERRPVARGAPDAAVHDEALGILGHLGIQVVLDHPDTRLGEPRAARERRCRAARARCGPA
jgi:hypothetical protein